uniref:Uncharacterized protein n=1 Tax=Cacopsylla melanoneura TaxID=428564 RepID=A0A8D8RDC7_9HEMI
MKILIWQKTGILRGEKIVCNNKIIVHYSNKTTYTLLCDFNEYKPWCKEEGAKLFVTKFNTSREGQVGGKFIASQYFKLCRYLYFIHSDPILNVLSQFKCKKQEWPQHQQL